MSTPSYRGGQQNATSGSNVSSSFVVPAGAQVGDLILGWWVVTGTAPNGPTPPTGWTLLGCTDPTQSGTGVGTANFGIWVYAKTCAPGDAGSTITFTSGATRQNAGCGVYYDADGGTLSVEAWARSSTETLPSLSTVAAACFGVAGVGSRRPTGIDTWTPPTGYTERFDTGSDASTGGKSHEALDKLTVVSAGTNLGGVAATPSSGDGVENAWLASIKVTPPAATDPGAFLAHM